MMRTVLSISLFLLVLLHRLNCQNCIPTAIVFSYQAQVDAFPSNYPGCTIIDGNVGITGSVQNLDSLIQLTKIGGSVQILNILNFNNVNGLANLNEIGGSLIINNNSNLNSLQGLENLNTIGGNLQITNSSINSIDLNSLDSIYGYLYADNIALTSTQNLNYIGSGISLSYIQNLGGINNLDTINGDITLEHINTSDLSFPNLKYVDGNLRIVSNESLTQISGFNELDSIKGKLRIEYNGALTNISGFNDLVAIKGQNYNVGNNQYFNEGDLHMNQNTSLINISGFSNLELIENNLELHNMSFITNISGFNHNISIDNIFISNCPFLSQCDIVPLCAKVWSEPNDFYLSNNGVGCSSIQQIQASCPPLPDTDNDGIPDINDNCINTPNPNQEDNDYDDIGNACDPDYDQDGDGITNQNDNCDLIANPGQEDANNDGEGNICDTNSDSDNDGVMDANDNCVTTSNSSQEDATNNGIGDACEDTDNDGIMDDVDNCIYSSNPNQEDGDNDDIGDACEPSVTCGSGNIILTNQDQVDNFKIAYPGCAEILGSLIISGSVQNLDSLNNIIKIYEDLKSLNLNYNSFNSVNGLSNLEAIGGDLDLQISNPIDISYFPKLDSVMGDVNLYLQYVQVSNINLFRSADIVGGNISLTVIGNNFTAFDSVIIVNGSIDIMGNFNSGAAFNLLENINGDISIYENNNANNFSFSGFNQLNHTNYNIIITGYNSPIQIAGFNNLISIKKNLTLGGFISQLNAFQSLDSVYQNFKVVGNGNVSLNNMNNLSFIGGDIELSGLNSIGNINNFQKINGNIQLTGFSNSNQISFPNLGEIVGNLFMYYNNNLATIGGFNNLRKAGTISISSNNNLQQITGFNLLDTITNNLIISGNTFLNNINGFDHPIIILGGPYDSHYAFVGDNPLLETCNIEPLCLLANIGRLNVGSNASGCNSANEVISFCPPVQDTDGDTINDLLDNCPTNPNTNQADANNDGEGNVCDSDSDTDNDGSVDSLDNCVTTFNPNQADANNDGEGDKCDNNSDSDSDGKNDNIDNCPSIFNPDQRDCNNNGIGDVCEAYIDNDCDGIANSSDNCPETFNPYQIDYNNNSIGDACENFPRLGFNTTQPKTEMHLSYSNVYLDHPEKGLIVKDHNGLCYKTVVEMVNNKAELKLVTITCP